MTDKKMICPNYEDEKVLGNVGDRKKWIPKLLEYEICSELYERAKSKKCENRNSWEQEADIINHTEVCLRAYKEAIQRELSIIARGKRKGWKDKTIRKHRCMILHYLRACENLNLEIQTHKAKLTKEVIECK